MSWETACGTFSTPPGRMVALKSCAQALAPAKTSTRLTLSYLQGLLNRKAWSPSGPLPDVHLPTYLGLAMNGQRRATVQKLIASAVRTLGLEPRPEVHLVPFHLEEIVG